MAIYLCYECDNFIDNDWFPCEEHPDKEGELLCPSCYEEIEEEPSVFLSKQAD